MEGLGFLLIFFLVGWFIIAPVVGFILGVIKFVKQTKAEKKNDPRDHKKLSPQMQDYVYSSHHDSEDINYSFPYPPDGKIDHGDIYFIDMMEGHDFEHYCAKLLLKNGFSEAVVTPGSGDQGVDILAVKDSIRYAVQCKNFATPLSNKPIQEVHAGKVFYNCHVGVVMTNSTFTPGAVALAQATGTLLWDRETLQQMMQHADQ